MKTLREAMVVLRRRGAMMLVPDLVEAVAGGPVKGTWWAHAAGPAIFRIASELEDHADVVVGKLAQGKVTFVHARLFPALARVVTDDKWRTARSALLDADARQALAKIEELGAVRADPVTKKALEPTALVRSYSEHSDGGKHVTVLESWRRWMKRRSVVVPKDLSFDAASAELAAAGIDLDVRKSGRRRRAVRR